MAAEDLELAPADHLDLRHSLQDLNVLFPPERLDELAASGFIDSVAPAGKHQQVLLQAFPEAWRHESPGLITELSFNWKED